MEALFYKELPQGGIAWTPRRRSLLSFLADVPDLRSRHGRRHSLSAILALVCCAVMCGAKSYAAISQWGQDHDIALMHQLGFTRKPPKLGGIRKVLMALNLKVFEHALTRWAETLLGRPIGMSSRRLRLSPSTARRFVAALMASKRLCICSLVGSRIGADVAQTAVPNGGENKTNEHKTALRLLERMVLKGRLITGDAMFCQRDLSQQVIDAEGHYFWFVKENQPTLLNDIKAAFAPSVEGAFSPSAAKNLGKRAGHNNDPRQGARSS